MENLDQKTCPRFEQVHHLVKYQHHLHHHDPQKKGIPENQDPKKPRKPGPQWDPTKTGKPRPGTLVGSYKKQENRHPGPYKKPENREPGPQKNRKTGTLKSKSRYRCGAGKAVPNVTLEKPLQLLYKSTFIYVLAQKATEFRKQNFKHFNFI